jgi:acylphosphatase
MKADNVVVTGLVQGVGFRWSARRAAERIGVRGWVRNRADGSVELHVEGDEERVAAMLAWLRAIRDKDLASSLQPPAGRGYPPTAQADRGRTQEGPAQGRGPMAEGDVEPHGCHSRVIPCLHPCI